jgi:hypothetical protein
MSSAPGQLVERRLERALVNLLPGMSLLNRRQGARRLYTSVRLLKSRMVRDRLKLPFFAMCSWLSNEMGKFRRNGSMLVADPAMVAMALG